MADQHQKLQGHPPWCQPQSPQMKHKAGTDELSNKGQVNDLSGVSAGSRVSRYSRRSVTSHPRSQEEPGKPAKEVTGKNHIGMDT